MAGAFERLGGADIVILAVGLLGERGGLPDDLPGALEVLRVNLVGAGSLLLAAARRLDAQRHGTLIVLSSVAGERVRRSNVVYGASKAGLDALAQGLGDALHAHGVRVMVVRPGFVHTRMTRGLDAAPLSTEPAAVARAVVRGARSRRRRGLGSAVAALAHAHRAHPSPGYISPPPAVSFTEPEQIGSEPMSPDFQATERQARRREQHRRRGLRRLDVAIGVLVAIVVLLIAPGVAVWRSAP